jgi:DNA polymerase I-like protein with 3'-5' exonuclease and polymerase domains
MRTSYRLSGTTSGRTATGTSSDYILVGEPGSYSWENMGLSFQQIPKHGFEFGNETYGKDIRRCYVPSPGYEFIEIDLSQAEARVVDVLANDYESLAEYEILDKHWKMAKLCFPELGEYNKKDPALVRKRQIGKTGKHASNYDESPFAFAMRMHMPVREATKILTAIRQGNPKIANVFHAEVRKALDNTRTLRTGFGRRREFFDRITPETYKEAYAYIPQGMLSDHVKFNILCNLEENTSEFARPLVEWHDSILSEVKIGYREPYIREFKRLAATPITFLEGTFIRDHPLVIPIEAEVGNSWYDLKGISIDGI